ncbi:MAG: sensor histidine kinase [Cyanobacteria bacterium J06643_13]
MSKDLGKTLLAKIDVIIESWIESIRDDLDVESAKGLAYKSVRNSIPLVLEALATLLSQTLDDRHEKLEDKGLTHGIVRAEQGYDLTEVVQEYGLLREVIFDVLKPDLLTVSGEEMLQTIKVIDSVIDRVISLSLESYLEARLQELEELQGQLLLTNQELTRLVATQKEDLSHLAHELKTPLNSIMGFSSLLFQQQQKMERGQDTTLNLKLTEKVIDNGRQLLRMINDALEISRYEAGKMELNFESVDVRSLLKMVKEALEPSARQKDLEVTLDCDRAPKCVETDPLRLQQIITNLVSNAIRYTESGTINISCQTIDNDRWTVVVADTGIGISPEAQTQIFEPYFRVGTRKTFSPDSTGLGLAIVVKMVELLQGTIDLASELNEGSSFTVTLPKSYREN